MSKFNSGEDILKSVIPINKCQCFTCKKKITGEYGYRNGFCKAYPNGKGKPNEILFENRRCKYYEHT